MCFSRQAPTILLFGATKRDEPAENVKDDGVSRLALSKVDQNLLGRIFRHCVERQSTEVLRAQPQKYRPTST